MLTIKTSFCLYTFFSVWCQIFMQVISTIPDLIKANETVKTIAFEDRSYEELISIKGLFYLVVSLLTLEWFIRKRNAEFR